MKNLFFTLLFFAGMATSLHANPEEDTCGENIANADAIILIEMGYGTLRAGLSTSSTPTVSFQADPKWFNFKYTEANFKTIFTQVFNNLNVTPSSYNIMVTHPMAANKSVRVQMTDVLMRDFNAKAVYFAYDLQQALYSAGKKITGAVVFSENNQTVINVYYEGYAMPHVRNLHNTAAGAIVNDLAPAIHNGIMSCDNDMRASLYKNIYLFGPQCTTTERNSIENEIKRLMPYRYLTSEQVVFLPVDKNIAVWKGMKAFVADFDLSSYWFTQADYQAGGANEILKKQI